MKRALVGLCFWALGTGAQSTNIPNDVEQLIQRVNPHVNLGVVVVDLNSSETLFSRNASHLFIPASNMKLFSEAAALMVLGPDYHFKNQLSISTSKIQNGVLQGNIYLQLSGDPSFSRDDLKKILSSLKEWNINTIQGNVYIDSSLALVDPYPPGWLASDLSYAYGASNAPVMIDANRLTVTVNPGIKGGEPAVVEVDDGGGAIAITNQAITKSSAQGCGVGFSLDQDNHLIVRGCVGVGQGAVQQRMAIKNPLAYAQEMIHYDLQRANIKLNGLVQLGSTPTGALLIATQRSKALSELMADTLKPSDNLYADSLYLHAAAKLNGSPVNWNAAEPLIKNFLQTQTGIDFSKAIFADGSGLSRYSLVTPQQTISLLQFLYQRFPLSYEYIAALPVSGRDGTLQKRFRIPTQQGFVRAKTGTMTGINSLSGYLYSPNGHTLAFAMYINRQPGKASGAGRPVIDALCAYFLQRNPGNISHLSANSAAQPRLSFQLNPTQAERQKAHQAKWRRLESALRIALKDQTVSIVYRNNELVVNDNQSDATRVWNSLQELVKKYPFAVMLSSTTLTINPSEKPLLVWVKTPNGIGSIQRTWTIREAA